MSLTGVGFTGLWEPFLCFLSPEDHGAEEADRVRFVSGAAVSSLCHAYGEDPLFVAGREEQLSAPGESPGGDGVSLAALELGRFSHELCFSLRGLRSSDVLRD